MKLFTLALSLMIATNVFAGAIENCPGSPDPAKCYATALDEKLNLILRKINAGSDQGVLQTLTFFWGKDCTSDEMGTAFVPQLLTLNNQQQVQTICDGLAEKVFTFTNDGYVDSARLGTNCKNLTVRPHKGNKVDVATACLKQVSGAP